MIIDEDVYLAHYTSPYYDPVKAHEYYMRNRELVGRQEGSSDPTQSNSSGAVPQATVKPDHKKMEEMQVVADNFLQDVRIKLKEIAKKLKAAQEEQQQKLADEQAKKLEEVATNTTNKIDSLSKIPKGLSKDRASELKRIRNKTIDKIRNEATAEQNNIATEYAMKLDNLKKSNAHIIGSAKESTNLSRDKISAALKSRIEKARKEFNQQKRVG